MEDWDQYDIHNNADQSDDSGIWEGGISDDEYKEDLFQPTFDQQVHSSEQNDCGAPIIKEPGKEDEYRKAISQLDPIDRLKQQIGSVVKSLIEENFINISPSERNEICRSVDSIGVVNIQAKYISPLAYVLGYFAYHRGFMITDDDSSKKRKDKMVRINKEIFNNLENINKVVGGNFNYGVFPPDVIRYMRLWAKIVI